MCIQFFFLTEIRLSGLDCKEEWGIKTEEQIMNINLLSQKLLMITDIGIIALFF